MFSFDNNCNKFNESYNIIYDFLIEQVGDDEEIIEQEISIRTK